MNEKPPRSSRRFLVGVAVAVVALVGTVLVVVMRDEAPHAGGAQADPDSPEGTVDAFVAAAGDPNPNQYSDAADCRPVLDLFIEDYFEFTDVYNCLPGREADELWGGLERSRPGAIDGDDATVETASSDDALRVTFELTRQRDAWKIDGFDFAFDDGPNTDEVEAVLDAYVDAQEAGDCNTALELVTDRAPGTQASRDAALSLCESLPGGWRDVEPTGPTDVRGDRARVRIEDLAQAPGWVYVITLVREGDTWLVDSMEPDQS